MVYHLYIIRPDKNCSNVDLTKEAGILNPFTIADVECISIECQDIDRNIVDSQDITRGTNHYSYVPNLKKEYMIAALSNVILGQFESTEASQRDQTLKYAMSGGWLDLTGKIPYVEVYSDSTSAFLNFFSQYVSGSFSHTRFKIKGNQFKADFMMNLSGSLSLEECTN